MRRKFIIEIGNKTDVGMVRENNQDYYGSYDTINGKLIIVCDGMGGYEGGEIASQMAVDIIHQEVSKAKVENKNELLSDALVKAHKSIKHYQAENLAVADMGTTAVLLLLKDHQFWYAHVGDSRLYLLRQGQIRRMTKDHSLVQQMVDGGIITLAEAKDHPKKNIITRALGAKDGTPDALGPFSAYQGDKFMLCSDGLYDYLSDDDIRDVLKEQPQSASQKLVDMANARGGGDNITVQVIEIIKGKVDKTKRDSSKKKSLSKQRLTIALLFIVILLLVSYIACIHLGIKIDFFKLKGNHTKQESLKDTQKPIKTNNDNNYKTDAQQQSEEEGAVDVNDASQNGNQGIQLKIEYSKEKEKKTDNSTKKTNNKDKPKKKANKKKE